MKKTILAAAVAAPLLLSAQSAPDLYMLSQTDQRGTARFLSMGGAFTALGGDLSTLTQNPAGIGVYRRSEIGATLDISPRRITSQTSTDKIGMNKTKAYCNNFGYVGTVRLDGLMRTFSWGASYNRLASFDRTYDVYNGATATSLTNYVASYTNRAGYTESTLGFGKDYNPYLDSDADWLSILSYSSYMINPFNGSYHGLYQPGSKGDAYSQVRESGYVDEYAIDFGGNVGNVVMWGIGFGITDLSFNQTAYYSEIVENGFIPSDDGMVTGRGAYDLVNRRNISGTGFNMKFGVIVKPINEFRIGFAVHTPTWYSLSNSAYAETKYSYHNPGRPDYPQEVDANGKVVRMGNPFEGSDYTDDAYYNFHMNAPWRIMVGAAAVIGNQAIVSLDYERQAFNDISMSYQNSYGDYVSDDAVNQDVKDYYKAANILRLGLEYRLTPNFSLRAGYNYASTTAKNDILDGRAEVLTAGTNPAYTMNKTTNSISVGLGYHYKAFYLDGAYVHRNRKSVYQAYTSSEVGAGPQADLSETVNSIVLSVGFRF